MRRVFGLWSLETPIANNLFLVPSAEIGVGDDHLIVSATAPFHYRFRTEAKVRPYAGGGVTIGFDRKTGGSKNDTNLEMFGELRNGNLEARLQLLEQSYQDLVYSELIYLLSHLRFSPDAARNHWASINAHRELMEQRMGSAVDVRVALASYFMNVEQLLTNPKIIEWQIYERTRSAAYLDELTQLRNYQRPLRPRGGQRGPARDRSDSRGPDAEGRRSGALWRRRSAWPRGSGRRSRVMPSWWPTEPHS